MVGHQYRRTTEFKMCVPSGAHTWTITIMSAQHSYSINHKLALWVLERRKKKKNHKWPWADGHAWKPAVKLLLFLYFIFFFYFSSRNNAYLQSAFKSKQFWWWDSIINNKTDKEGKSWGGCTFSCFSKKVKDFPFLYCCFLLMKCKTNQMQNLKREKTF